MEFKELSQHEWRTYLPRSRRLKSHSRGSASEKQDGGGVVNATLSSTKNRSGKRNPEMHQTKKDNQWHFGMRTHIGTDADPVLVHTVMGTAANVNDVTQAHALMHGEEMDVFTDAGYQGVGKRRETRTLTSMWSCNRASARC